MKKFVISTSSFNIDSNIHVQYLLERGLSVVSNPFQRKLNEDEIIALLDSDVIGLIAGIEPLTARVFAAAKQLKVVSRCGTGMDSVDLDAAAQHNIAVYNTPEAPAQAVAELTLGLMLSALRRICQTDKLLRQGEWSRQQGSLLAAQTVGIIGMGRIGKRVAQLCQAFGAKVIVHDPNINQSLPEVALVSFKQLVTSADIITLHLSSGSDTHHLLNSTVLAQMKSNTIIINAARGGLVDEAALIEALDTKKLGIAALDVFEQEPYQGPLLTCDNIILTSHIGSLARESRQRMEIEAAENLLQGLVKIGLISDR